MTNQMNYHTLPERVVFYRFKIHQDWTGQTLPESACFQLELESRKNGLLIDFKGPYYGDPAPIQPAGSCPELWEYEVIELFLAQGEQYTEIELGPAGHYLVLQLQGERNIISQGADIRYQCSTLHGRWMGTALIPWALLPPGPWTGNAYAIHGKGATRRYTCAFKAESAVPDFHRLESFQCITTKLKIE